MSLYGTKAPSIVLDSLLIELEDDLTEVELKYEENYKDSKAYQGTLHRKFHGSAKVIYNMSTWNLTDAQLQDLYSVDGEEVYFYPHSDNGRHYYGYISITNTYINEKYFHKVVDMEFEAIITN